MTEIASKSDLRQFVIQAIAAETGFANEELNDQRPLAEYGIESVLAVAIVRRLEECLGELSKALLFEFQCIGQLVDHLALELKFMDESVEIAKPQTNFALPAADRLPGPQQAPEMDLVTADGEKRQFDGTNGGVGDEIAIVGIHGRFPQAENLDAYWQNLSAGRDCITEIPLRLWDWREFWNEEKGVPGKSYCKWGGFMEDSDRFDPLFFNISNLQAEAMDPQERIFLETVHHTLEDAGYTREALKSSRVGVYVAAMWGSYQHYGVAEAGTDSSFASIANRASYVFGFCGPSIALDTTCSGSLTALHLACESLRRGECDMAVAGGVNITSHPQKYLVLSRTGFAATDGRCRSFGAEASGYVPGDGSGALLLKPLAKAVADGDRIHAVIRASAINHGGRSSGFTVPSADAQAALIEATLDRAGLDPKTIGYIEAHAPGTALGDPIEVRGLSKAFGKHFEGNGVCPIGSVKSNIGHLESAAGIASLAKVILQMRHRQIAPSLHAETINPNINFEATPFYVNQTLAPWRAPSTMVNGRPAKGPRRAGVSSFGAGGSNAHVILEEHEEHLAFTSPASEQLIVLSAKTDERLNQVVRRLRDWLDERVHAPAVADTDGAVQDPEMAITLCVSRATKIRPVLIAPDDRIELLVSSPAVLDRLAETLRTEFGLSIDGPALSRSTIRDLIGLSAQEPDAFDRNDAAALEQIAFTLQIGREAMERRLALRVRSTTDLRERLDLFLSGNVPLDCWTGTVRSSDSNGEDEQRLVRTLSEQRQLDRLAAIWTSGVAVPWETMYPKRPSRIALPLYPFERIRCWVNHDAVPNETSLVSFIPRGSEGHAALRRLCYRPVATRIPSLRPKQDPTQGRATVIVYPAAEWRLAESFKKVLPADAWEIVLGRRTMLTGRRSWEVDSNNPAAVATCLRLVESIGTVWFLCDGVGNDQTESFDQAIADGTMTLLHIAQSLVDVAKTSPVRLRILTKAAIAVTPDERVQPHCAMVRSFARAIAREHPELGCQAIDLPHSYMGDTGADFEATLRLIVEGNDAANILAIRGNQFFRSSIEPFDPDLPMAPIFKTRGSYVLLGGNGTVGRRLSRALAERAGARLIWLGRRALDADTEKEMAEIERLGGSVAYRVVDATDTQALAAVLADLESSSGPIDGVFHLAKFHEICRLDDLSDPKIRAIIDAKARTTVALEAALARRQVGFVVLFSSAEAHVGSVGWSGYSAACAFQDATALEWRRRAAYPVVSINWGYWEGVDQDVGEMLAKKGIRTLDVQSGLAIAEMALAGQITQLAALDVDGTVLERMGFTPRQGEANGLDLNAEAPSIDSVKPRAPEAANGAPGKFDFRTFDPATFRPEDFDPDSFPSGDELPSRDLLLVNLTETVSEVLRIDRARIEPDADLITYGIDSLTVIALHKTIEAQAGTLPATLFILAKTLNEVADELLRNYPVAACALAGHLDLANTETVSARNDPTGALSPMAPATGTMRRIGTAPAGGELAYLDGYGSRFYDKTLAQEAASAEPQRLTANVFKGPGLDHLLVDTPFAAGVELLTSGAGAPVLLLSAVGLTAPTWRHQFVSPLARSMRLNAAHVPGYGLTNPISDCSNDGVTRVIGDLIELISPDRPIHIVASCLGCITAMNLARTQPERVASLTLVGGFHDTSDMNVADPARLTTDELTELLNGAVDRTRDDFAALAPPGEGPDETPAQQCDLLLGALCANALVALRYLTEMLTLPVLDWLPAIRVPTQCIYGTKDLVVGNHHSHTIAAGIKGARLHAIEGAGHFPYLTHSAQFNPLIDDFIAEHEGPYSSKPATEQTNS